MAVLKRDPPEAKLEKQLQDRIFRGREHADQIRPRINEAWEFYRGNHYAYVDADNKLQILPTSISLRAGKPRHRARQARNLIFDHVLATASLASQRVPSYQVVPATTDPEDISAAHLAEKIALYGYTQWNLRQVTVQAVVHAIVGGEGFAWPYFDNQIGPFIEGANGEVVGQGDVRVRVFGSNECYWEPGLRFEDSPWHVIEHARPISEVEQMEGYLLKPDSLTPDAATRGQKPRASQTNLVLVTEYLERPCPAYPEGRWVTMANKRRIIPDRPYPGDGTLALRKLSYAPDPDSDRDISLVSQLLDAQRTHNDANSKAVEWKNHCLIPRIAVTPGLMGRQRWTDEPGKVYEIPNPNENLMVIQAPPVPAELFEMADRAERDMGRIAAQNSLPSQPTSGAEIQARIENDDSRLGLFIAELAEWHSQVMHDCLELVQAHYTEDRLIQIRGDFGWESIEEFRGVKLRGQTDVRVMPESIEPRTKAAQEQKIMNYANMGWISPEEAMAAIELGTAEVVTRSIAADEARAGRIIQRIKEGPESLFSMPSVPSDRPGAQPGEMVPSWMPRYSDNLDVFQAMFEDFTKTEEFESLSPDMQEATAQIYQGILELQAQKAQQAQMAQMAQAEQLGMQNATKAPYSPMPSLPRTNGSPKS